VTKPADKVQIYKRESSTGGGDPSDNDEFYGEAPLDPMEDAPEVQGLFIQDKTGGQPSDEDVYVTRDGNDLKFKDKTVGSEVTLNDLYAGAGGLSEGQHAILRQLIHFVDEGPTQGFASGAYKEVVGGLFPTQIIWWESAAKLKKIVETDITRAGGGASLVAPTPVTWKVYDTDGITVSGTVTDNITYSGIIEISRTRIIS
jgi:hypothetical protein